MAEIAVRTLDHDRIAVELEAAADYAGWARRLAAAVSASPPAALSGHQPDTEPHSDLPEGDLPNTGPRPDTGPADEPATPERPRVDTGAVDRSQATDPDSPGRRRPRPERQAIARGVAEALSRTPQPTQVEIAQELGISDRSVRRYRDELLVNGKAT
jgi:hypothetical protein